VDVPPSLTELSSTRVGGFTIQVPLRPLTEKEMGAAPDRNFKLICPRGGYRGDVSSNAAKSRSSSSRADNLRIN